MYINERAMSIMDLSDIFLRELFRVTAAKPLKQLYHPHNFRDLKVNKTNLILARDLQQ